MNKKLLAPVAALGAILVAQIALADQPDTYRLDGPAVFPEGVAFDARTQSFYVSSTNGGAIYRGELGDPQTEIFLDPNTDGRTFAAGLEVDADGRLFISGGGSGKVFVYDTATKVLLTAKTTSLSPTFINDVAITRNGDAFFTDSLSPVLYRLSETESGWEFEEWLDFTGTALVYQPGFNVNGIEATADERYLIVVQSNTGKLFRIDLETQEVVQVDLGGGTVLAGDGLVLRGHTLWVVRNSVGLIVEVRLGGDYASGEIVGSTTDPSFAFPTTAAIANGRMLVVNSQFNRRASGDPVLPFTVSSIPVP